jgi:hypothetical protein
MSATGPPSPSAAACRRAHDVGRSVASADEDGRNRPLTTAARVEPVARGWRLAGEQRRQLRQSRHDRRRRMRQAHRPHAGGARVPGRRQHAAVRAVGERASISSTRLGSVAGKSVSSCGSMAPSGVWSDTRNMGADARRRRLEPVRRLRTGADWKLQSNLESRRYSAVKLQPKEYKLLTIYIF